MYAREAAYRRGEVCAVVAVAELDNDGLRGESFAGASTSGTPKTIANKAAREKLSTAVTEMTVEAKQRVRDLRTSGRLPWRTPSCERASGTEATRAMRMRRAVYSNTRVRKDSEWGFRETNTHQ